MSISSLRPKWNALPSAVAVVFEGEQLTYRELNRRANQLAHHLQKLGVGPEVLVGVCVERSLEMLVGLLGIHKAGGAYVPLDPAYPQERLAFMLQDSQVKVLLTQERLQTRIPEQEAQIVCLDTNQAVLAQQSETNLSLQALPLTLPTSFTPPGLPDSRKEWRLPIAARLPS